MPTEDKKNLSKRLLAYAEKISNPEYMEDHIRKDNAKDVRKKLIKANHYHHILQIAGENILSLEQSALVYNLAKEKIVGLKNKDEQRKEITQINLIDGHTAALNIAKYYYEKASKTLCQMMVTLMDYILQEKGESSILYDDTDQTKYFSLLDEIKSLNDDYQTSFFSLCAYDYCTEKLGDYMSIPEYKKLFKEHDRIIENGNPKRVSKIMERLRDLCGERRREVFIDIEKAYTPEPEYSEDLLEKCYEKAVEIYENEDAAMMDFTSLVERVNLIYQRNMKD